jgi:hypothetical protein
MVIMAARKTPQPKGHHGEFISSPKKPEHSCTCNKDDSPTLTLAIEISQENEPAESSIPESSIPESSLPSFREDVLDACVVIMALGKFAFYMACIVFLWYATQYIAGRV